MSTKTSQQATEQLVPIGKLIGCRKTCATKLNKNIVYQNVRRTDDVIMISQNMTQYLRIPEGCHSCLRPIA